MFTYLMYKLGLLKKYVVEYNSLVTAVPANSFIDYYDYRFIPDWLLKERCLEWMQGKVLTCVPHVIYIERIGHVEIKSQCIY